MPNDDTLEFYVNDGYYELQKIKHNKTSADQHGFLNIPTKFAFWTILYQGGLYALNSRRVIQTRIIDQFSLSEIEKKKWVDSKGEQHEPIESINISHGYCLRFKLKEQPTNNIDTWILCFENDELRKYWLKNIQGVSYLF